MEIRSTDFSDIMGYQFTLEAAGLELLDVVAGAIDIDPSNFGVFENGAITTSWNSQNDVGTEDALFSLVYRSNVSGLLSEILQVTSTITRAEAYRTNGDLLDISIQFDRPRLDNEFGKAVLYQNTCNFAAFQHRSQYSRAAAAGEIPRS